MIASAKHAWRTLRDGERSPMETHNVVCDPEFDVRVDGESIMFLLIRDIRRLGRWTYITYIGPAPPRLEGNVLVIRHKRFDAKSLELYVQD